MLGLPIRAALESLGSKTKSTTLLMLRVGREGMRRLLALKHIEKGYQVSSQKISPTSQRT